MKKFYRNRHSSFLTVLAQQRSKKEDEEKASREAEEKKRAKLKAKVLAGHDVKAKINEI